MLEHGDEIGISRKKGVFEHRKPILSEISENGFLPIRYSDFIFQAREKLTTDTSFEVDGCESKIVYSFIYLGLFSRKIPHSMQPITYGKSWEGWH